MKIITIVSGKGGAGKTMVAGSLAWVISREKPIITVDCDVDAPNLGLILGMEVRREWEIQTSEKVFFNEEKCLGCFRCVDACKFNAIERGGKKPKFNRLLCEGCGACEIVCPGKAIEVKPVSNAWIREGKSEYGFPVVMGELKMGESGSGKIVTEVRRVGEELGRKEKSEIMVLDSAAGVSCPVIASLRGSDFAVLVTEPTPSGFQDLKRVLGLVEFFRIPSGLVINKVGLNPGIRKEIEDFASQREIPILGKIPYHRDFVDATVNLKPVVVWKGKYRKIFERIWERVKI